ncbi:hypothetical protein KCTC52924_01728 [Arenibacter antarcticus]|uniref:Uncharacterized protein n=1 Tax=Arenibacter antarcticus TaxID=2040469 RepID=A0ABW5VHB7_9FLAO|nr:hypothetical protein [Arenibacter sp. H213]
MELGEENTELLKNQNDPTRNYILQKNKKTKIGASIITVILVLILVGIIITGFIFDS